MSIRPKAPKYSTPKQKRQNAARGKRIAAKQEKAQRADQRNGRERA